MWGTIFTVYLLKKLLDRIILEKARNQLKYKFFVIVESHVYLVAVIFNSSCMQIS